MHRRLLLIAAIVLLIGGAAFADPGPAPPSNTGDITSRIFEEPNDVFLDVLGFQTLDSNYVFLQFDMPSNQFNEGFEIGGTTTVFGPYIAGYLRSETPGVQGLLGGNEAATTAIDEDFNVDGANQIIGSVETRTLQANASAVTSNDFRTLVGLGDLGVYFRAFYGQDVESGFFSPGFTFPGGTSVGNVLLGGFTFLGNDGFDPNDATGTVVTTSDAAGDLVSLSSTQYANGISAANDLRLTAAGGLPLPLGDLALAAGGGLTVLLGNDDVSGAVEAYGRAVGTQYAISYTPDQTLDGDDPVAIENLTRYEYEAASGTESGITVLPFVFAELDLPLNEVLTAQATFDYFADITFGRARYTDTAGAEQFVNGEAASYERVDVQVSPNPGDPTLTQTVTTTERSWNTVSDSAFNQQGVTLSAGLTVTPSETFRFGVRYTPSLNFSGTTRVYDGEAVQTVVTDNGDGANGAGDSVEQTVVTNAGYTERVRGFRFNNSVDTAAQFYLTDRIRVNLGAKLDNTLIDRTVTEIVTLGVNERTEREATATTTVPTEDAGWVVTNYDFDTEVRADPDAEQALALTGSSQIQYEGGFTFFFNENMFLDLRMDATGGDIWNTNAWSLEMTIRY